jgi:hypothetical protein
MEELFFFFYHLGVNKRDCMTLPVHERKWILQRFISQKSKENDALEKAKKAKKR